MLKLVFNIRLGLPPDLAKITKDSQFDSCLRCC